MMLGYTLARAGVPVVVLEKHADFLRDFRGDTVHPSTLQILDELDLLTQFRRLNYQKVSHLGVHIGGRLQPLMDLRGLKPFDHLVLVPQWDFLDMLAGEGRKLPAFDLRMRHEAIDLLRDGERTVGVRVNTPQGETTIRADLVVACDGRRSILRAAAGLHAVDYGAPMDVLWFRLPRAEDAPEDTFGIVDAGHMMVLLDRGNYWQAAFLVAKGGDVQWRSRPIRALHETIVKLAPFLANAIDALTSWDDVKTLQVNVDRLTQWHQPGLLLIGDAAHAMSPIGGVGINLAIQDAIATANILAPALCADAPIDEALLHRVQKRRMAPVKLTQALQLQIQKRLLSKLIEDGAKTPRFPWVLRWLLHFRVVRRIPARVIGYGLRQEHVHTPARPVAD